MLTLNFSLARLSTAFNIEAPVHSIQAAAGDYPIMLAPINLPSDDERVIVGSLGWRSQVPLMFSDSEEGHGDARMVGNVIDIRLETVGAVQWAVGRVDWDKNADNDLARTAQRLVDEGRFNGTSIHIGKGRFADVCPIEGGGFKEVEFPEDWVPEEVDGELVSFDPPCENMLLGMFEAELAAATIVAIPAFPDAGISVEGQEPLVPMAASAVPVASDGLAAGTWGQVINSLSFNAAVDSNGQPWVMPEAVVTQAAASLDRPRRAWFDFPEPDEPTPPTITDEGQFFAHLAVWETCHTGFQGRCVQPPRDTDYSYFQTARVITDDGERIAVGPLVVDDGHAPASWSVDKVMRYYADTRLAAAYVTIRSGKIGPWATGVISHKATPGQIETLRRHALSGDWRKLEGKTRLIAVVSVNAPGFVVPEVLTASGEEVGLVTYGPEPLIDEPSDLALVAAALTRLTELVETYKASPNADREVPNILSPELQAEMVIEELEAEVDVALALDA